MDARQEEKFSTVRLSPEHQVITQGSVRDLKAQEFYVEIIQAIFHDEEKYPYSISFGDKLKELPKDCRKCKNTFCCLSNVAKNILQLWSLSKNGGDLYEMIRQIYHGNYSHYTHDEYALFLEYSFREFHLKNGKKLSTSSPMTARLNKERFYAIGKIFKERADDYKNVNFYLCLMALSITAALAIISGTLLLFFVVEIAIKYSLYVKLSSLALSGVSLTSCYATIFKWSQERNKNMFYQEIAKPHQEERKFER